MGSNAGVYVAIIIFLKIYFERNSLKSKRNHCVKSIQIRSFSGPYFSVFGMNEHGDLPRKSPCEKLRTRKTPYLDNFYAVNICYSYFRDDNDDLTYSRIPPHL